MKAALLQIKAGDTLTATLEKGVSFCRRAKEMGADLALFPEMFSNGYRLYGRPVSDWMKEAPPATTPRAFRTATATPPPLTASPTRLMAPVPETPASWRRMNQRAFGWRRLTWR